MGWATASRRRLIFWPGRWLMAWLVMLAVLFAGLGDAWRTGQADPWCWAVPMVAAMAVLGFALRRSARWVGAGAVGMVLLLCGLAAARWPDPFAAVALAALALLAAVGGWALRARRRAVGGVSIALAALLFWAAPDRAVRFGSDRPALAVITALPLFWKEGQVGSEARFDGPTDAPIITVLRTRFTVRPIDDPQALADSGARRLLLAQPRAFSPAQMEGIDQWVRGGGRALVLADPLLRWPSDLPLGDRRRAPSTSLLGPLLDHWGFQVRDRKDGEVRALMPDGRLVTLSGVQDFAMKGDDGALIARRRIGRGEVLVLGDADLLDDRLWLADPARPLDPRAWSADTPALLVHWLGGVDVPGDRRWMRLLPDVQAALRWALLLGTGWVILGGVVLGRGTARGAQEQKRDMDERSRKEAG
ncbi:MAG: DUF4350 domain-containing protein [Sphingobium sp.]